MVQEPAVETGRPPGRFSSARRDGEPAGRDAATMGGSTLLLAYMISLFIPGTFPAGPIVLTFYKLILMLMFVPLFLQLIQGRAGRLVAADFLVAGFCLWIALTIFLWHGLPRIPFIGTQFIELLGAYMVGRVMVRNAADHLAMFRYLLYIMLCLLPFALIESILGQRLLTKIFSYVLSTQDYIRNKPRLGFTRVALSFHNPIHFGFVCSLTIANFYYIYRDRFFRALQVTGLATFMTLLSLSSGAMFSIALQLLMTGWDRILHIIQSRWVMFVLLGFLSLAILQLSLPGGIVGFIVNEVIFNPEGGDNRISILQYGFAEVVRNPVFGIGLNDWIRPYWQHSTVDNFWLLITMRHGIPAMLLLAGTVAVSAIQIMRHPGLNEAESRYRTGYLIGLAGMTLVLGTVHVWQAPAALVMTYVGAGVWFYNGTETAGNIARLRQRRTGDMAKQKAREQAGTRASAPDEPAADDPASAAEAGAPPRRTPVRRLTRPPERRR